MRKGKRRRRHEGEVAVVVTEARRRRKIEKTRGKSDELDEYEAKRANQQFRN